LSDVIAEIPSYDVALYGIVCRAMAILALVYDDDDIPRNEIQCPESWVESWWHREKPT
jgi:hypothetical protein